MLLDSIVIKYENFVIKASIVKCYVVKPFIGLVTPAEYELPVAFGLVTILCPRRIGRAVVSDTRGRG
jgi:hypothetical protein